MVRRRKLEPEQKFPLKSLDHLIAEPKLFTKPTKHPIPYSRSSALRNSMYRYHKTKNATESRRYLEVSFDKHGWSKDVDEYTSLLFTYIENFEMLGWTNLQIAVNVELQTEEHLHSGLPVFLHGQVSRYDFTNFGYAVTIIGKEINDWPMGFKYPLLQYHFAKHENVPAKDLAVAIYDTNTGVHEWKIFGSREIDHAKSALKWALNTHLTATL